jgi:Domain of unknown function (DUF4190)
MKQCPQCNRKFTEPWLSFCSDDGAPLFEELTPSQDPNWDSKIREPKTTTQSEQETQWLPREPPVPGGWVAPDERAPLSPGPWQPPPPPYRPPSAKPQTESMAVASMIVGIIGIVLGGCLGPIPGIVALALGLTALSQIKKSPEQFGGKPYATAGVIIGAISTAFYLLLLIWFLLSLVFR